MVCKSTISKATTFRRGYVRLVMNTFRSFPHSRLKKGFNYINMTGASSGAGTAYPSEALEFTPVFSEVRATRSLVLCVMLCRSLFVLFLFAIVLSVLLLFMGSDYPFGIFSLFLVHREKHQQLVAVYL